MGTPSVGALLAEELEETFLGSLGHEEGIAVPLATVLVEELGECFLRGPLDEDPLECLLLPHEELILERQLAINVVLDLLNAGIPRLVRSRHWLLEPVSYFENVPSFKRLIVTIRFKVVVPQLWLHLPSLKVFPAENHFLGHHRKALHYKNQK